MTLTTIQYGSIASSETLNSNFDYLDNRISTSNETINTSISTLLSNIATINSRITEVSESLSSLITNLSATVEEYKTKTKLLVKKSSAVPNWTSIRSISFTVGTDFTATSNGYVLILPTASSAGNLTINSNTVCVKDDISSKTLIVIPVKSGDVLSTTITCESASFLPSAEVSVENF